ncbi:hypothetical protein CALCODRAFT_518641 [Calocera cornea HHB12733]|uniref:SGNH hydrolase-type esterase domain-containing protein n=1 Tax=Calocera cornea HHB12733 TaxID=1353952 RepID=A0A165EW23_9BASI|nr:hypothetical protein CALCODRAFT_518641 [Calocera cornea HHB12733]
MRGEPIKMAVLGGSVSRGRNSFPGGPYHGRIFRTWNETFFPHPQNTIVDGSRPATGTKYFSMCWGEHIPEDIDLVFLEQSINDRRTMESADNWETLARSLLELPHNVAVISISTFALEFAQGIGNGGDVHLAVAQYYDIPVISIRNAILPHLFDDPALESEVFGDVESPDHSIDRKHINALNHQILSDFTTHWMKDHICKVASEQDAPAAPPGRDHHSMEGWWNAPVDMATVPRLRMSEPWTTVNQTRPPLQPSCKSTTSEPRLAPSSTDGWSFEEAPGDKFYWSADTVGAQIHFSVHTVSGHVGMFFLRSPKLGLGNVRCWLDGNLKGSKVVEGYWTKDVSTAEFIELATELPTGTHELTCEIARQTKDPGGGHAFKIIGLATV